MVGGIALWVVAIILMRFFWQEESSEAQVAVSRPAFRKFLGYLLLQGLSRAAFRTPESAADAPETGARALFATGRRFTLRISGRDQQ